MKWPTDDASPAGWVEVGGLLKKKKIKCCQTPPRHKKSSAGIQKMQISDFAAVKEFPKQTNNGQTQQWPPRLDSAHGIPVLRDATSLGKWRRRRRQLTRGLTCQSCPVNLSHWHWLLRLLLNSLCDMLLAARTA